MFCNCSGDSLDGGKVRITVWQRWRSYTDKDRFSPGDRFIGRPKAKTARFSHALDNVLQMRLKQWHPPNFQFAKLFEVAFAAEDIVADLGQASSGRQTYVARAND